MSASSQRSNRVGRQLVPVAFTVNGAPLDEEVEPRQHLADFLRERLLLTGTHLGCEHGVCGACTVLIDGQPARSCITYAADCSGADVTTIEGLEEDTVTAALRTAFTAEHALQCGYCTPGMLVTARDIVCRLPEIDDDGIRLELAGNLCRCTGYNGIVKAIRRVLDLHLAGIAPGPAASVPQGSFAAVSSGVTSGPVSAPPLPASATGAPGRIVQKLTIAAARGQVWAAVRDPALIAGCVPGVRLGTVEDGHIAGEMVASLGPIQARFTGTASVTYDDDGFAGQIRGQGSDQASGTRLSADATFTVLETASGATTIQLEMNYALQGALAQFSRGPIVQVFAAEIAATVGRTLEARLRGEQASPEPATLNAAGLAFRALRRWVRGIFSRSADD